MIRKLIILPQAITVHPYYAALIASGQKTLELRSKRLLKAGQHVVVCSGAPEGLTLCECEVLAVFPISARPLRDVLRSACVGENQIKNYRATVAHELRVIRQLAPRRVRGGVGVWELRKSRHSRDAGLL